MTNSDSNRAVISDAECEAFLEPLRAKDLRAAIRQALAAFLEARIPKEDRDVAFGELDIGHKRGFNACREQVLRGKV